MAMMTSSTTELAHQYQTYFSKKMLPRAKQALVLEQFAARSPFPKNAGSKTIRFFRKAAGAASNVTALTEGVALATYREIDLDYVEATLVQYGEVAKISDVLSWTELFNTLNETIDTMGEDAALHADQIIRNEIVSGITAAGNKRYAQGLANFNALVAASASAGKMTIDDLLGAMTQLQIKRAPHKNGEYVAIVPPEIAYNIMLDTKFVNLSTYSDKSLIMNGEVGKWYGVRIVVTTVPFREAATDDTEGTYAASGPIYTSIVVGSDAFGSSIMAGGSPFSPKVMISDKADKADPLNQYLMAGWKSYWTAKTLNPLWAVTIRSKTTFA